MAKLHQIARGEMPGISQGISARLTKRMANGPAEPGLDIFIGELDKSAAILNTHVFGKTSADAARTALIDVVDLKDAKVDTNMRHIEAYIGVESRDRRSPHASAAGALYQAAFPKGLEPVDDYIIDQNIYCRATLNALRAPEHQETITAIGLPAAWIDALEANLKESEAAMDQLIEARGDKSAHVGLGRNAEADWVDLMVRLRRQVDSRAKRGDTAKQIENKQLLEPLLVALQKLDAETAARATRKKEKQAAPVKPAEGASSPPKPAEGAATGPSKTPQNTQTPATTTEKPPVQTA